MPAPAQILDALAPLVEAAEAEAPPSPMRGRLAQVQTASMASLDSLPSRAGSLPLPLVVTEPAAAAEVSATAADVHESVAIDG